MDASMICIERNGGSGRGWLEAWSLTSKGCYSFYQHMGPMDARYVYGLLFLVGNFIAWGLRENPTSFFQRQRLSGCHGNRDCFAAEAVLMVSFTFFLFSITMFLSTMRTRSVHDFRSSWHSKWWGPKIALLASCFGISIFAPTYVTQLYGKVAPFGAGLFLIIQLISVIRYITRLNSKWCGQANFENHRRKVNIIIGLAYLCSVIGIVFMVVWYVGCYVNTTLVVATLLLVYIMPIISLLAKAKGCLLEPLLMGVYIVFLCWSAIKSEPKTSDCYKIENAVHQKNKIENPGSSVNWITVISFIAELISVTVATFSTGTEYKRVQFTNRVESENDVPYGYGFFHFDFAMGAMYFGMLFLGWETHHASERWSMDVGWTSTIVHIVTEGLVVMVFVVVILARRYEIGWLQQLLGKIFGIGGQQLVDESRDIELPIYRTNNNGPAQESPTTQHEGIETGNNRSPQDHPSLATERDGTETDYNGLLQRPGRETEPAGAEGHNAQPSSSSSSTTGPVSTSESQLRVGRQWGEIIEHW